MPSDPAVTMSADLIRQWARHARVGLASARAQIDSLNVFPVPDGDTGTNLLLTMESGAGSVEECCSSGEPTGLEAAQALARGALLGARGNSGVILSQILRGASEVLGRSDTHEVDGRVIDRLLQRATELAYSAVAHPVEGTILTVVREAAEGATALLDSSERQSAINAMPVIDAAIRAAENALARTPEMLEALRLAGVVDAGGQGLIVVLKALRSALEGRAVPEDPQDTVEAGAVMAVVPASLAGYTGPAYEVMYLLDADAADIPSLKAQLDALGDSLVVVGEGRLWNVHVHVDDAGAAIEAGLGVGRPWQIRVTHLDAGSMPAAGEGSGRVLVAVSHAPGTTRLLRESGAITVTAPAQGRPSAAELLAGIQESGVGEAVLLPSDKDTVAVAEIAADQARENGLRVSVIPTRSIVQTLAAVAVHDPSRRFEDDVVAMTRAAGATRYGAVTIASRAALTTAGPCSVGDVLGLVDGDIVLVGADVRSVVHGMLAGMLAVGGELVTVLYGLDAPEPLRRDLRGWLAEEFPLVEVADLDAGQPLWPVIVGVE